MNIAQSVTQSVLVVLISWFLWCMAYVLTVARKSVKGLTAEPQTKLVLISYRYCQRKCTPAAVAQALACMSITNQLFSKRILRSPLAKVQLYLHKNQI